MVDSFRRGRLNSLVPHHACNRHSCDGEPGLGLEEADAFLDLTRNTITEFYLAPADSTNWGPNQCKTDKDGAVDSDERLRITDISSGIYGAGLIDKTGRVCVVRNVKVEAGGIFTIEEEDLTSCSNGPRQK